MRVFECRVHIPPFDHPLIVDGHSSLVFEVEEQLIEHNASPLAAVICSAGGGGLLGGVSVPFCCPPFILKWYHLT